MTLADFVNDWVTEQLENATFETIRDTKAIRDALLGMNVFFEYEINVIDLPIVQRLRRICQTGFAYLTYPSACHTRFDHTLGVMIIADKLAKAIREKEEGLMDKQTMRELRLAGILHDIGHGPFSHVSESIYTNFEEVKNVRENNAKFDKCKTHEMISYMIVTSPSFKDFFNDHLDTKNYRTNIDLTNVANMIVGKMDDPRHAYMADIINGSFDADKLDYIVRDCHFTGLKMNVDIDRILHTISIEKRTGVTRRGLIIAISGAPFVEQVLFNKMLLYTSIYHHHKIRTLECMFRSIFEVIEDYGLEIDDMSFNKVTDFLSVTDPEILTLQGKPEKLKPFIRNIRNRKLLKRALVISKKTVIDPNTAYQQLQTLRENPVEIKELREAIVLEANSQLSKPELSIYDVWIDLPEPPSFGNPSRTLIKITEEHITTLRDVFPIDQWLTTYAENKWMGHVFCHPQKTYRNAVHDAAVAVFRDFGVEFNQYARKYAKMNESS